MPVHCPFRIDKRVSKSVVQLEVGVYKDGTKRFELRHLNDLRLAHPDSMAAPARRPKLGRPSLPGGSTSTEPKTSAPKAVDDFDGLSSLPSDTQPVNLNKQIQTSAGNRPVRSTRNPNPCYVDSIQTGPPPTPPFPQWSHRPWSASPEEIFKLNASLPSRSV